MRKHKKTRRIFWRGDGQFNKKFVLLFLLILAYFSLFPDCSSPAKNPEGQLLRFSGCKNFSQDGSLSKVCPKRIFLRPQKNVLNISTMVMGT